MGRLRVASREREVLQQNVWVVQQTKCAFEDYLFSSLLVNRDRGGAQNIDMLSYLDGVFPYPLHDVWSNRDFVEYVNDDVIVNRDGTFHSS